MTGLTQITGLRVGHRFEAPATDAVVTPGGIAARRSLTMRKRS